MYLHRNLPDPPAEAGAGQGAGLAAVTSAGVAGPCCSPSPAQHYSWYQQISPRVSTTSELRAAAGLRRTFSAAPAMKPLCTTLP